MGKVELFRHPVDEAIDRPDGVRTQWVSVTPEYATKVLDDYEKFCDAHPDEKQNRPVHQVQVDRYAADMKAGRWGRNHQGIAFDANGILMDGQHRLWAVIESGATVMMPVTYGLDREAQLTIDSGLKRSTADVAAIAGFHGVREFHVGIVRALVRGVSPKYCRTTRMQELELLRDHWKAVEWVTNVFPKTKMYGLTRAPVMAAVARAYYTQDEEALKRFVAVLIEGIPRQDNEHVIIVLREWLRANRRGTDQTAQNAYGKTSRALQAYLKHERIRTLYAAKEEVFPIQTLKRKA